MKNYSTFDRVHALDFEPRTKSNTELRSSCVAFQVRNRHSTGDPNYNDFIYPTEPGNYSLGRSAFDGNTDYFASNTTYSELGLSNDFLRLMGSTVANSSSPSPGILVYSYSEGYSAVSFTLSANALVDLNVNLSFDISLTGDPQNGAWARFGLQDINGNYILYDNIDAFDGTVSDSAVYSINDVYLQAGEYYLYSYGHGEAWSFVGSGDAEASSYAYVDLGNVRCLVPEPSGLVVFGALIGFCGWFHSGRTAKRQVRV